VRLRHPALVVAAAAVTLGAVLTALAASSEGSLWKMLLVALALGLPGALAATEHPRNPVGWLLLATACVLSAMGLAGQASPAGSAGEWAAWLVDRAGAIVVPLMFLALVLLPDGRLPGPRWRPAVAAAVGVQVACVVAWSLVEGDSNPLGVLPASWSGGLDAAADWLLQAPLLLAAAAIAVRLRRPADRAGLSWVLAGALGFALLALVGHSLVPAAADALDVLGAVVLGAGLTVTLLHRPTPEPEEPAGAYDDARLAALSAREREVLDLVAQGLTNRQIAERLVISPVTARNHVSRILGKLGLDNRTQAAAWLARSQR
jgi:DNA-binding CsgD family transcriptional regulator